MIALLAALLAASAAAAPLDEALAAQAARGWVPRDRVTRAGKPFPLAAVVYARADGTGGNSLEVYALLKGRAYTVYMHPATGERLDLDAGPVGRGMPDLLRDGSRVVAFRSTLPALRTTSLHILSVRGLKVEEAARFPEGNFISLDGEVAVVSRSLPLGRVLAVDCEDFGALSHNAFKTTLHAPRAGRFADVSSSYPGFYDKEIARKKAVLARMKSALPKDSGEYFGLAVSLYYDYAARGKARYAWEHQAELYPLLAGAPGKARACVDVIRADMRKRLAIPADWPDP